MPKNPPTEINLELIQALCLEAGRIMEDVSAELALTLPSSIAAVRTRAEQLHLAATDIMALANAARALVRSGSSHRKL